MQVGPDFGHRSGKPAVLTERGTEACISPGGPLARVALFTDSDAFAGTERHMLDLASGLAAQGLGVSVLCPGQSPLAKRLGEANIKVFPIEKNGLIDVVAIVKTWWLLKTGTVDIVHAHNGRTALLAAVASFLAGACPPISTQHFLEPTRTGRKGLRGAVSRILHRWVDRNTSHLIAVSEAARARMLERGDAPDGKISVIPNGLSLPDLVSLKPPSKVRSECGVAHGAPLVVCLARLEKEKDISSLIAAMSEVVAASPDARCVIAGEGSQAGALTQQIQRAGMANHIRLTGFTADPLSLINACDVFVLPSLAEPFGMVLLEAMALCKPVIATQAGGPKEIVVEEETGILVPPASPERLALAILRLINSSDLRGRMGAKARTRLEGKYSVEKMTLATMQVYLGALRRRTRAIGRASLDVLNVAVSK